MSGDTAAMCCDIAVLRTAPQPGGVPRLRGARPARLGTPPGPTRRDSYSDYDVTSRRAKCRNASAVKIAE
jgi:hypothetical protein